MRRRRKSCNLAFMEPRCESLARVIAAVVNASDELFPSGTVSAVGYCSSIDTIQRALRNHPGGGGSAVDKRSQARSRAAS